LSCVDAHGHGRRARVQGDPTYLVVEQDKTLATYGINAVCTHLGCVVPWNSAENKFICPCHGSQYNNQGKVVRGPAPLVKTNSPISSNWKSATDFVALSTHLLRTALV
jgi:Rieske Fe-S protein